MEQVISGDNGVAADNAVVGIDVSAARLDCYRLDAQRHWQVSNAAAGWAALVTDRRSAPPRLIVLDATGTREQGGGGHWRRPG